MFFEQVIKEKVEKSLIPVLEVDLQDIFQHLTFDNVCLIFLGYDPKTFPLNSVKLNMQKYLMKWRNVRYIDTEKKLSSKEDNLIPYRLIRLVFAIPVPWPVQKH